MGNGHSNYNNHRVLHQLHRINSWNVEYTVSFQTPERKGVKKRDKQINGQSNDTPAINKGNRIKDPSKGKENII